MDGHRRLGTRGLLLVLALLAGAGEGAHSLPTGAGIDDPESGQVGGPLPEDPVLEANGARIGRISIQVKDVFDTDDPEEDKRLFRLVNRLHVKTRPGLISSQLLFETGDLYSPRLLRESERLLRGRRYLYDVEIRPERYANNRVDIRVTTRDVWTLTGGVNFSHSGGVSTTELELQDSNFLGTGRDVTLSRTQSVDRTSSLVRYRDLHLLGTRAQLELWSADNSDGRLRRFELARPFFSLDSRWAASVRALDETRIDSLYSLGVRSAELRHHIDFLELSWGRSRGWARGQVRRWSLGLTYDHHRFSNVEVERLRSPAADPRAPLPDRRTLAYPWFGFEQIRDAYVEERNIDRLDRSEDLFLGRRFQGRLGWSSPAFGGDRERAVFDLAAELGTRPGRDQLLFVSAQASGRWGGGRLENTLVSGQARLFWQNFGQHRLYVKLQADLAKNLDRERQLLLGGDNGLRGYPLRYQEGDRRLLLTLEQRFYTNLHLFKLVHVGAAAFVDVGWAGFENQDLPQELGLLRDVGVGLRLSPSRSGRGTMVHLDVAFPFDGDASIKSVQWLVTTRDSF